MNPNMQKSLEAAKGKSIRIDIGQEKIISGELKEVFPEYLVLDVPVGSPYPGIRHVFVSHIRWIGLPKE